MSWAWVVPLVALAAAGGLLARLGGAVQKENFRLRVSRARLAELEQRAGAADRQRGGLATLVDNGDRP